MKNAFVLYYSKENRYSYNALLGALESTNEHANIDVFFYDPKKPDDAALDECIKNYKYVILGLSFFTSQVWDIYKFVKHIREKYGNRIILIAGGSHPSGEPKATLDMGIDFVFIGEGEETINEFFSALRLGNDIEDISGIYSKKASGEYSFKPRKGKVDLNKFIPFSEKYKKFGPLEISRGCPFACYFCQTTRIFGTDVRHRDIAFIEELLNIMKKCHLKDFRAITPNALAYGSSDGRNLNLDAVYNLLSTVKRILPEGKIFFGSFPSEVRPEHVTEESMNLLCQFVNNDNIIMGAQTGSQRMLELTHRGHSVSDVYNAVEICLKYNLTPNVDFIFGLPGETYDDIIKSIDMMNDLIRIGARIHAHTFMPLPQTPFAYKGRGKINDELRKYIRTHVSEGAIYGDWAEQARQSKKIDKLLKTKRVDLSDL